MTEPKRILVIRLSALGDVLLATPAVRALAKAFPGAEVDWLVEAPYRPLVAGNPHARAIALEKRGRHYGFSGLLRLRKELASEKYDLVVDLQGKPRTVFVRGAGGARVVAFRKRTIGQGILALLGGEKPLTRAHAVDLFLEVVAALGCKDQGRHLELHLTADMEKEAASLRLPQGAIGLSPGARWASKRWPIGRFAELAAALAADGHQIVLIGGPGESADFEEIRRSMPRGMALPDTSGMSVGGLAAAIAKLRLLVTGDSGPSHVASALGVPVVAIFGPTSPERWRPVGSLSAIAKLDLACSPCSNHGTEACPLGHHDCMRKLETRKVLEVARGLLAKTACAAGPVPCL